MWGKDEEKSEDRTPAPRRTVPDETRAEPPGSGKAPAEAATIGPSITITGDVSGDEDLLIHGRVEGSVDLEQQSVTVGREGRVKANITGRVVVVEGEVEGDLEANEQVILRSAAHVEGDITAPRVVLEDGANFRGLVDMSSAPRGDGPSRPPGASSRSGAASAGAGGATETKKKASGDAGSPTDDPEKGSSKASAASGKTGKASS